MNKLYKYLTLYDNYNIDVNEFKMCVEMLSFDKTDEYVNLTDKSMDTLLQTFNLSYEPFIRLMMELFSYKKGVAIYNESRYDGYYFITFPK